MLKQGLIQVYTSESGRPNPAPLGLCLRAAGHGFRVLIADFGPPERREWLSAVCQALSPLVVLRTPPPDKLFSHAYADMKKEVLQARFDMVILLDVFRYLRRGHLKEDDLLAIMNEKPGNVELVLSGQEAGQAVIQRADLVTEMTVRKGKEKSGLLGNGSPAAPSEVVTGNGKGKTTYCLGEAMRQSCLGTPSTIIQFVKSPKAYGEVKALANFPLIKLKTMGEGFLNKQTKRSKVPAGRHLKAAKGAWEEGLRNIFSSKYGLAILDEINLATYYGLTNAGRVREMIYLKPPHLHLVLSGRNANPEVTEEATSVIEMKEIKHPYKKGIKARKGIEF